MHSEYTGTCGEIRDGAYSSKEYKVSGKGFCLFMGFCFVYFVLIFFFFKVLFAQKSLLKIRQGHQLIDYDLLIQYLDIY